MIERTYFIVRSLFFFISRNYSSSSGMASVILFLACSGSMSFSGLFGVTTICCVSEYPNQFFPMKHPAPGLILFVIIRSAQISSQIDLAFFTMSVCVAIRVSPLSHELKVSLFIPSQLQIPIIPGRLSFSIQC